MSTKSAVLHQFFSRFGLDAYEENSIFDMDNPPAYPYITYENKTDALADNDTAISFSLWYRSTSWIDANAKAEAISAYIGQGGKVLPCDGGYIWIKRDSPFAQSMGDAADDMVKRKYCSLRVSFLTAN